MASTIHRFSLSSFPIRITSLSDETDLPTEQNQAQTPTRVPRANVYKGWPISPQGAQGQGAEETQRVECTTVDRKVRGVSKEKRLRRSKDYQRVFESSCRSVDGWLVVLARENGLDHSRLGFAVSRSHVKTAVNRNRIKRVARESFRLHQTDLRGLDLVIVTRKSTEGATNQLLLSSLKHHWRRVISCRNS